MLPPVSVTPKDLKDLRNARGLSISEMATMLGLDGKNASKHLRDLEAGKKPISGPISKLVIHLQEEPQPSTTDNDKLSWLVKIIDKETSQEEVFGFPKEGMRESFIDEIKKRGGNYYLIFTAFDENAPTANDMRPRADWNKFNWKDFK